MAVDDFNLTAGVAAVETGRLRGGEMSGLVHIALASDQRYFDGLLVTAFSLASYADKNIDLVFHILDGGIEEDSFLMMSRSLSDWHPRASVDRIRIDPDRFSGLPSYHASVMIYARILLPQLLPQIDFVLYCDVDFLWLEDVAKLWRLRNANVPLMGVADPVINDIDAVFDDLLAEGYKVNKGEYICSGLLLMNLRKMREEKSEESLLRFVSHFENKGLPDQNAYNAVFCGRVRLLDEHWMRFNSAFETTLKRPVVLHYASYSNALMGLSKLPFFFVFDNSLMLWLRFYAAFSGMPLNRILVKRYGLLGFAFHRMKYHVLKFRILRCLKILMPSRRSEFEKLRPSYDWRNVPLHGVSGDAN